jgi:hypothetical protein
MITVNEINFFIKTVLGLNPNEFSLTVDEFSHLIFPLGLFKIIGVYGKGQNGLVLQIASNLDQVYAMKLSRIRSTEDRTLNEYNIQKHFAEYNMAPTLHKLDVFKTTVKGVRIGFVRAIMDPIYMTMFRYIREGHDPQQLFEPLMCLLKKKYLLRYPKPYLHSDMHIENIVILQDQKTLGFIDFGYTIAKAAELQILDCIPLIGFLKQSNTSSALLNFSVKFYERMFKIKINLDKFIILPQGGYGYQLNTGKILHSYNWIPDPTLNRNPLGTLDEIRIAFPTFEAPIVTD